MECLSKKLLRNICHTRRHYSEILRLCPDISGGISGEMGTYPYGAFKRELGDAKVGSATGGSSDPSYSFKASRSNSVYGPTSYGVSVDAVYTLIIIKA